ncbi:hypothetical protein AOQ84DRAFT_420404 [Glonium stellatum]|uniref:Uncharacterized protein n=1 Tax=Glonium stellatum TaxID=574774 RepID=A0A8E2F8W7_9PEZI|nr:hypothetical protein AOQ84DRAFT_420404 [Glonium stellatum]
MWRIFNPFARGAAPMSPGIPTQDRKHALLDDSATEPLAKRGKTREAGEGSPTGGQVSPTNTGEGSRSRLRFSAPKPIIPLSQQRGSQAEYSGEPAYVERDAEVRDELWRVIDQVEEFAKGYFAFDIPLETADERFQVLCSTMSNNLKLIVGCIGAGGPGGAGGWKELFVDKELRQALVCGIIGNVLVEQVFASLLFGATMEQREKVHRVQAEYKSTDGFLRTKEYYKAIKQFLPENDLPAAFESHAIEVTMRLYTLLVPILALNPAYKHLPLNINAGSAITSPEKEAAEVLTALWDIVTRAAVLSISMRLDPDTVYYFEPTGKDDWYDPQAMECFNMKTMEASHPRKRTWAHSEDQAEKERAQGDGPLVRIICMDGCTAYRQGGWLSPDSPGWKSMGFRSRRLTQALVACRWGRKRKWVKGQPADRKEVHGTKWVEPGFVEFRNVVEKIQKETLDKIMRKAEVETEEEPRDGGFLSSLGKTFGYMI